MTKFFLRDIAKHCIKFKENSIICWRLSRILKRNEILEDDNFCLDASKRNSRQCQSTSTRRPCCRHCTRHPQNIVKLRMTTCTISMTVRF